MTPTKQRRVLLVDDEKQIVDALQRLLRPHRALWEVTTTTSSRSALAMLQASPFDVLVSDMRMPEMDGATLLAAVKETCPATARVILSGQTDPDVALRSVGVAHQFLSKPAEPGLLLSVLNRIVATHDDVGDPEILAAIGGIDRLPSVPRLCRQLMALASGSDVTVKALVAEIEPDPAVVVKLLQIVNSAFFGLRRQMTSVAEAVAYLGTDLVKNLVVSLSIVNSLPPRAVLFDADAFGRHALDVAQLARFICGPGPLADVSFVGGMLHAVGKLVLAFAVPEAYDRIAGASLASGRSFEEEEVIQRSCGHSRVGGYLLDLWGLPAPVVEVVVEHMRVHDHDHTSPRSPDAVYLARKLLEGPEALESAADRALVARLGLGERLPELVARAARITAGA